MNVAVYARTSTANGAGSDSLGAQEAACREWAAANGHDVVAVYRDDAISGGTGIEDRPGLAAALLALEGDADGIVVHRLDRLARELHVQEVALSHAWSIGPQVEVFEVAEGGAVKRDDPDDPHRRFLRQVMGAAAELERGLIRARLAGGRRRKAAQGGYIGGKQLHPKYGYRLVDGEYVEHEDEQRNVVRIVSLREVDGLAWQAVADALNAEHVEPPSGAAWYGKTASRIYARTTSQRP